jgi:Uma2 family endonuclease
MTAIHRTPGVLGYGGLRMTAAEYFALAETEDRYELIDGVVVMSPSPTPRHQRVAFLLALQIERHAESASGIQVIPDVDIWVADDRVCRPDIVVYAHSRLPSMPIRLTTPPDLVIEVLSPGSEPMDYITKRDDYDRFGVVEYWVVDPRDVSVRCWRRQGAKMLEIGIESLVVACASVPGLAVDLERVRSAIGRP